MLAGEVGLEAVRVSTSLSEWQGGQGGSTFDPSTGCECEIGEPKPLPCPTELSAIQAANCPTLILPPANLKDDITPQSHLHPPPCKPNCTLMSNRASTRRFWSHFAV